MQKTLYLHIGEPKTASSAIQTFLFKNQELLKKKGIIYPGYISDHHAVSRELLYNTIPQIEESPKSPTKKILKKVIDSRYSTFIISSENFCRLHGKVSRLKKMVPEGINVKVVYYVRRQDNQIEAIYNQIIRGPKGRNTLTVGEFIHKHCPGLINYQKNLNPWEEAFGRENIIVRCYEDGQLKNDIFSDFLDAIGLEITDDFVIPKKRINQSLDWDIIELIRLSNVQYGNDEGFRDFLLEHFEQQDTSSSKKKHMLSPEKRRKIIEYFEESNTFVARTYLGRDDGRLFYEPLPDLDEEYAAGLSQNCEKINPAILEVMHKFYERDNSIIRTLGKKYRKGRELYTIPEILKIAYYRYIHF